MKKIISFILSAVVLAGALFIPTSAAGTLIHSDDFTDGFAAKNWMTNTGTMFKWNSEGFLYGYGDARVLETRYGSRDSKIYDKFYASFDVKICDFDDIEPVEENHIFGFWYRDLFESETKGPVYQFFIEAETGDAYILKSCDEGIRYRDENNILQTYAYEATKICEGNVGGPVPVGNDAPYVNIGLRVTEGRIEGYYNEKLVCYSEADPNAEKVGDTYLTCADPTVGSQKCPILFWSGLDGTYTGKLYVNLDNFEVWTDDYDFSAAVLYGDANGDTKINLGDVSLVLKKIAKWDVAVDETAADVNADGKVTLGDVSMMLKYIAKWDIVLGTAK